MDEFELTPPEPTVEKRRSSGWKVKIERLCWLLQKRLDEIAAVAHGGDQIAAVSHAIDEIARKVREIETRQRVDAVFIAMLLGVTGLEAGRATHVLPLDDRSRRMALQQLAAAVTRARREISAASIAAFDARVAELRLMPRPAFAPTPTTVADAKSKKRRAS